MKVTRLTTVLLLALSASACSTLEDVIVPTSEYKNVLDNREAAASQLAQASICCQDFTHLTYTPLPGVYKQLVSIGASSPVFNFTEGRSFFAAYQLPQNSGDLRITLSAQIDKTVFVPRVVMLDAQFRVTRIIDDKIFKYVPAQLLDGDQLQGVFTIDRTMAGNPNNETYMVVYTPENGLNDTTTITHPSKLMAKSLAVVDPGIKDPEIPHSAWGLVKVEVEDLSGNSGEANIYKPAYQDTVDAMVPKVDPAPNKLVVAAPAATAVVASSTAVQTPAAATVMPATPAPTGMAAGGTMLAETEQLYNQLIEKAVSGGDIEKAMQLATEAERVGSATAKATLVNAIKRSQK